MSEERDNPYDAPGWMSIPRAAKFLGVSATTMRDMVARRQIRFYRPSKHPRLRLSDLIDYQKRHCRRSCAEAKATEDLLAD